MVLPRHLITPLLLNLILLFVAFGICCPRHLITPLLLEFNIIVCSILGMLRFRCMFWFMATLVWGLYDLWPLWFVAIMVCSRYGLWPLWFVAVLGPFWF